MSSEEVTEWGAVFRLESEEIEAITKGLPARPARLPSQAELRQKIERAFRVAA